MNWFYSVLTALAFSPSSPSAGRRKPIVVGPHSISVVVDGEGHTLANVVRDTAWLQ